MINAEISKTGNENALSMLRKFSRRVQGTGLTRHMRNKRYHSRPKSPAVKKKSALKRIARTEEFRQLVKEGKRTETSVRTASHSRESQAKNTTNARKD